LLRDKFNEIATEAKNKITKRLLRKYYKSLFKKRIFIATVYLETP
jgi:hypothetical protein